MKRLLIPIILIVVFMVFCNTRIMAQSTVQLDKGAFVLVYAKKTLSTEILQEGDRVYFVSPADIWVGETNIVPKNSVFVGYVNMLKMPIKGVNAAMGIKITHIVLPSGQTREFDGTINNGSGNIIGGELTPPASYNKMAHPYLSRWKWSGSTQWVPSGDYEYGKHRGITPGQKMFIVLDSPYETTQRE